MDDRQLDIANLLTMILTHSAAANWCNLLIVSTDYGERLLRELAYADEENRPDIICDLGSLVDKN